MSSTVADNVSTPDPVTGPPGTVDEASADAATSRDATPATAPATSGEATPAPAPATSGEATPAPAPATSGEATPATTPAASAGALADVADVSGRPGPDSGADRAGDALRGAREGAGSFGVTGGSAGVDAVSSARAMGAIAETMECLNKVQTWQLSGPDVQNVLEMVGLVRHRLTQLEVNVTAEALERKLPGERGLSPVDYLVRTEGLSAPAPPPRDAARAIRLAEASRTGEGHVGAVMSAFGDERLSASKADALVRFHDEAKALSDADAHSEVMGILLREAKDDCLPGDQYGIMGRAGERVAGLSDRELQIATRRAMRTIKPAKDLAADEQVARNGRSLHSQQWNNGMTEYRMVLDPESAAIVDAAISALSAPAPVDGVPDSRSAARRRADALIMIVQRGVSAPGQAPKTEKAQVMVTINYEDLVNQLRGSGVTMTGQVLSPQTVRRMACDAGIIPMILGTKGEILDIGRTSRLFTPGQRRAMWHRDKGCTFPDCTMPAPWCEAHHVIYWTNGGLTDISNGALLCPRHHTHVHQHDLTATVTTTAVTWHT